MHNNNLSSEESVWASRENCRVVYALQWAPRVAELQLRRFAVGGHAGRGLAPLRYIAHGCCNPRSMCRSPDGITPRAQTQTQTHTHTQGRTRTRTWSKA
eukprot:10493019-Alexandrium_andersonii.AAC.1